MILHQIRNAESGREAPARDECAAAMRTLLLLALAALAPANPNGLGRLPPRGWNTWCTGASCDQPNITLGFPASGLHDNCSEATIKSVASDMVTNGMLAAGWDHINMDDCWGATNLQYPGGVRGDGPYRWDPQRFPSGIPALASWLHARGFKFGLYTASGNSTCSSGGRKGFVPGSVGHFEQDAQTFADWGVDYVKLDWCIHAEKAPTPAVFALRQNRTNQMAMAMNKTGRPMWLTFHCEYSKGHASGQFAEWCARDGNSWRIGPDHHDNWFSLEQVIQVLGKAAANGRPFRWNDPDFLMTGGAGCDVTMPGKRCPGMSEVEYRTEFSLWTMGAASMILSTDPRNMTAFMRSTLLQNEMLAIHRDPLGISGGKVADHINAADFCGHTDDCQVWARPLADGSWAMALFNRQPYDNENPTAPGHAATITGNWSSLPSPPAAGAKLKVRDVWLAKDLGTFAGSYTAEDVPPHATVFLHLELA